MTLAIALLLLPLTLLTCCFSIEVFLGLRPLRQSRREAGSHRRAIVIVPAHNEAKILSISLPALKDAARIAAVQVLLVADNCIDTTADIARDAGLEVIERQDPNRRGKGFALDFARHHLEGNPPELIVIVDADCRIDGASLTALIGACAATGKPCQATNLQEPALGGSPAVQLSTFAFFVKNVIRQRALQRLAGRAHLLGTGMALPWPIFSNAKLASGNIVEDLALGQELSHAGHAPLFVENATVWSKAETESNTLSQRRRWEGGFLQNALRVGPAMLLRSIFAGDPAAFWASINTIIPPFALLILLDLVALAVAAGATLVARSSPWPLSALSGALLAAFIALGLAWRSGGSRFVSLRSLAGTPFYLVWKIPLYLGFARAGAPKEWHRTSRS